MLKYFKLIVLALLLCGQSPHSVAASEPATSSDQPKPVPVSALDRPNEQVEIWVDEKTGTFLPLEIEFTDENGSMVTLGGLIDKPTILLPIYFYCPNSCPTNLANLAAAINRMKMEIGDDYRAIALSFNHLETPENARTAKNNYLKLLYDGFPEEQWSFLTGSQENVAAVLDTIGFSFQPRDDGTFIHASTLVTVASDGKLIKYVYGSFIPGDVEIALAEAAQGVPARSIKRLLNYCFNYDPDTNKWLFEAVKVGVIALFAGVAVFIFFRFIWRKKPDDPDGLSSQHG